MIFTNFVSMKTDEKLAEELRNAVNNISGMNWLIEKGLVLFNPEVMFVEVNYLIWHSFSTQGLAKFCHSLYFNMRIKVAASKQIDITAESINIYVNYGAVPNEYGKIGVVKMCQYNSVTGFGMV